MTNTEPVEPVDTELVETEKTTNDLSAQDDVWVDDNQSTTAEPDLGHTSEDEPDDESDDPVDTIEDFGAEGGGQ